MIKKAPNFRKETYREILFSPLSLSLFTYILTRNGYNSTGVDGLILNAYTPSVSVMPAESFASD
ncbi:MAG: hypothetical protein ACYCSA_02300 [Thermoplasmataceae archaeon]